uniref:Uncharacterized protein n=1 Tax=Anguilla anguilla TaxID=7936 RepID=A0A0E9XF23_ANGAN
MSCSRPVRSVGRNGTY